MFEFLITDENDAITILKHDHDKVKDLFDEFEKTENLRQQKKIVAEAIMELKVHATIEEELFYPSLRRKKEVDQDLLNESDEEHHVAKVLIAELEQMSGSEDHYKAKFTVLSENIRHHIKEEEGNLFPQARKTDVDFIALGKQLLLRKQQLKKDGIPPCAEEKLISLKADSPAKAAKGKTPGKVIAIKSAKKPAPAKKASRSRKPVLAKSNHAKPLRKKARR